MLEKYDDDQCPDNPDVRKYTPHKQNTQTHRHKYQQTTHHEGVLHAEAVGARHVLQTRAGAQNQPNLVELAVLLQFHAARRRQARQVHRLKSISKEEHVKVNCQIEVRNGELSAKQRCATGESRHCEVRTNKRQTQTLMLTLKNLISLPKPSCEGISVQGVTTRELSFTDSWYLGRNK